jgi:signal transduction histidine kinase
MELPAILLLATVFTILVLGAAFLTLVMYQRKQNEHKLDMERLKVKQQKELIKKAAEMTERERRKIGQELHDQSGPELAAMKHTISMIRMMIRDNRLIDAEEQLGVLDNHLLQSINRNRDVSHLLYPVVLKQLGLQQALTDIRNKAQKRLPNAHIRMDVESNLDLDETEEIAVYRIAQELMNNAIKHSRATEIYLHLRRKGNAIHLDYTDDGVGLESNQNVGFGMDNIQTRVKLLEGNMEVQSNKSQGTHIFIQFNHGEHH